MVARLTYRGRTCLDGMDATICVRGARSVAEDYACWPPNRPATYAATATLPPARAGGRTGAGRGDPRGGSAVRPLAMRESRPCCPSPAPVPWALPQRTDVLPGRGGQHGISSSRPAAECQLTRRLSGCRGRSCSAWERRWSMPGSAGAGQTPAARAGWGWSAAAGPSSRCPSRGGAPMGDEHPPRCLVGASGPATASSARAVRSRGLFTRAQPGATTPATWTR